MKVDNYSPDVLACAYQHLAVKNGALKLVKDRVYVWNNSFTGEVNTCLASDQKSSVTLPAWIIIG